MKSKIKCKYCSSEFEGRIDKIFCSTKCKSNYNYELNRATKSESKNIDSFLHRNREILAILVGNSKKCTVDKSVLDQTGFKYKYITSYFMNGNKIECNYVYDFSWEINDTNQVLIKLCGSKKMKK